MKLEGNTVLITGGTSGIGLGLAKRLLDTGNRVIVCGRRRDRLEAIQRERPAMVMRVCDVSVEEQRASLAAWAVSEFPELNVIINNAGIQLATDLTSAVDVHAVRNEIETNLVAPIHLASLFVPHLRKQTTAAIVNISSGLAFVPIAYMPVYCATKAAIHSLSQSLRHQLRDTSVAVYEIAPPSVDSELGHQHRTDPERSHGGMPVEEFVSLALAALARDDLEAAVGAAAGMRENPEALFSRMNH